MSSFLAEESLSLMLGPLIEREATNPEGAPKLREVISHLDSLIQSWNEAYDEMVSLVDTLRDTADEWEGKPTRGPGPFDISSTPFLDNFSGKLTMTDSPVWHFGGPLMIDDIDEDG